MGQHTWFVKNKKLLDKVNEIYDILDKHENGDIWIDSTEKYSLEGQVEEIDNKNDAGFHDIFRTSKRNQDGTYTDDILTSLEESLEFINTPENKVHKDEFTEKRLREFWEKFPDGAIYFG